MTDRDFDKLMEEALPELPPDDVALEITPWRRAMGYIIGGSGLCSITLSFLNLEILLPLIGVLCQLLGFRALRRENRWFGLCWWCAAIRCVLILPSVAVDATIYRGAFMAALSPGLSYILIGLNLLICFGLWRGIRAVENKWQLEHSSAPGALLVWNLIMLGLAVIQYTGWLFAIALLACYILILRCLSALSKDMEEHGYALTPAPVRVSDGVLIRIIVFSLLAVMALGFLFCRRYPMDWQPEHTVLSAEAQASREDLLALGYPEQALDDLTDEDLLSCAGALQVAVHETDEAMNDGREVRTIYDGNYTQITTVYDVKELHLTDTAVQLPGDGDHWLVFHHFRWTQDARFPGTEDLQIWPAFRDSEGWRSDGGVITGRVLYDRDGTTYSAPYYALEEQSYTAQSPFFGSQNVSDIFADFSMPRRSENQRGYVSYGMIAIDDDYVVSSWINYTHQDSLIQFPIYTAREQRVSGSWGRSVTFRLAQNALQFWLVDGKPAWV